MQNQCAGIEGFFESLGFLSFFFDISCGFVILECIAPAEVLRQRVNSRALDASDADQKVLDAQLNTHSADARVTAAERAVTLSVATDRPVDAVSLAADLEARLA